ncbi:MAG: alpha/beta hydrolase [Christensenellales bacterium]|jgi:acetyl esterase/lipase|nr:alpha/beta hydrolase [Clostridia bacterium]HRU84614.1 alpha/beta hydrolase [Eubacteriales bacterium]
MSLLGFVFKVDDLLKDKWCNDLDYPGVTEENNLVYDERYPDVCRLDLLYDESKRPESGKFPVLLNIHGGGWIVGDKKYRRGFSLQFADAGIAVVNINYGLGPKYRYPFYVQNIYAALKWIEEAAGVYGFDLDNLFISGDSAGAHLSAVTLVSLKNADMRQKFKVEASPLYFKSALLYCGPYDFDEPWFQFPLLRTMTLDMTGIKNVSELKNYEYYSVMNPIPYITSEFPRTMVITGKQDFITKNHNVKLINKLIEQGVEYKHFHATDLFNSFHCFHLKIFMSEAKACLKESIAFVKEAIKS